MVTIRIPADLRQWPWTVILAGLFLLVVLFTIAMAIYSDVNPTAYTLIVQYADGHSEEYAVDGHNLSGDRIRVDLADGGQMFIVRRNVLYYKTKEIE